jgi:serine phosphatase RsbU (regulator of sigma subunit)
MADSYNNLAYIYDYMGNLPKALEFYFKTIPLDEKNKNYTGMSVTLGNIGLVYVDLEEYEKAKLYYNKSLLLLEKYPNLRQLARTKTHLGYLHSLEGNYDSAKFYYNESLIICLKNDFPEIANSYNNLAKMYYRQGNVDSSYALQYKSLEYAEKFSNWDIMIYSFCNIGIMEKEKGNYKKAKEYYLKAYDLVKKMKIYDDRSKCLGLLSEVNELTGDYKISLQQYKEMTLIMDSIYDNSKSIEIGRLEAGYEYEKQKVIDDAKNDKLVALEKEEKAKQRVIIYSISFGSILLLLSLFIIFNRLRITKRQKIVIENQKEIVDIKNQEITDSIRYAKRIQSAILPPSKIVKEYLKESFILYKPKDVVAGDFYWMEHKDSKVIFAAADCTGHGVPGAMVSVVCNNALNRSVREHGLTDPGEILTKTREIVIQEFEKSEEDVKDGMDIALCSLDGMKLQYAGAHNPLWIIRKGELIETKANKQPIGQFDNPEPYTTHSFDLEPGDSLYLFSDGYVDQFGGPKGKKFMYNPFRKLLLSIQEKSMEEQKTFIDEAFEAWKGSIEQIDDVCVIGVRV